MADLPPSMPSASGALWGALYPKGYGGGLFGQTPMLEQVNQHDAKRAELSRQLIEGGATPKAAQMQAFGQTAADDPMANALMGFGGITRAAKPIAGVLTKTLPPDVEKRAVSSFNEMADFLRRRERSQIEDAVTIDDVMRATGQHGADARGAAAEAIAEAAGVKPKLTGASTTSRYYGARHPDNIDADGISFRVSDHGNLSQNPPGYSGPPDLNIAPGGHSLADLYDAILQWKANPKISE